jgi:Flp pilus assembly protein CpaB
MFALKSRGVSSAQSEAYRPHNSTPPTTLKDRFINLRVAGGALILLAGVALLSHSLSTRSLSKVTTVLVAAQPLHRGEVLVASDLRATTVQFSSSVVASVQAAPLHLLGRTLNENVAQDEIVTTQMLTRSTTSGPYRQAVISVAPSLLQGAPLTPGDRVDVLVTYGSGTSATTQAIATSLLVLSVDTSNASLGSTQSDTVTVALTSLLQGLAIAQGENVGKITLIPSTGLPAPKVLPIYPPIPLSGPATSNTVG